MRDGLTYTAERIADLALLQAGVVGSLALAATKDLAGVPNDLADSGAITAKNLGRVSGNVTEVLNTLLDIGNIQALLAGLQAFDNIAGSGKVTLGVHCGDVLGDRIDDLLEVVHNLLRKSQITLPL